MFGLVLCIFLFNAGIVIAADKVSRFDIVSSLYERVYNQDITEMKAVSVGLLEPFDDGQYHLAWSVTRGMAAKMFYTLAIQSGAVLKIPRAFADIRPESDFRVALYTVGGAFLPHRSGKFNSEHILTKKEMYHAISVLIEKGIFKQTDMSNAAHEVLSDPVLTEFSVANQKVSEKKLDEELSEMTPFVANPDYDHNYSRRAIKKLGQAEKLAKMKQMNPQAMNTIENAFIAMKDVKKLMHSVTASTIDLIELKPKTDKDRRAVRNALAKIENVLTGMVERFEYSKVQLNNVIPVDPAQIRKCSKLNADLVKHIKDAWILRDKITSRIAERR